MEGQQYIIQQHEEEDEGPREGELREQDRFLPIYNISKVMKKVVPHSGKVAKEARECVQECVSEFISFITRSVNRTTRFFNSGLNIIRLVLQRSERAMPGREEKNHQWRGHSVCHVHPRLRQLR
jgi:hypothetical protein